MADFCLISQRHLADVDQRIFRTHYLLGADWRLCCRQLRVEKGQFFHHLYDIEVRLGRVFAELTPYCLYPISEYFSGLTREDVPRAAITDIVHKKEPRRPAPLRLSA